MADLPKYHGRAPHGRHRGLFTPGGYPVYFVTSGDASDVCIFKLGRRDKGALEAIGWHFREIWNDGDHVALRLQLVIAAMKIEVTNLSYLAKQLAEKEAAL